MALPWLPSCRHVRESGVGAWGGPAARSVHYGPSRQRRSSLAPVHSDGPS